jgi:transcriptional regulator with XRE-family HTH domain
MNSAREVTGPNKLRSWLAETGYSQKGAADLFSCDESMVSHMLAGRANPGLRLANRIAVLTDGAVVQTDWDDPADLLPQDGSATGEAA